MNWITLLHRAGLMLLVLLGVAGYLLIIANVRANQTQARVQELLRLGAPGGLVWGPSLVCAGAPGRGLQ
ncbi:MAG: hypothetical protein WBJ41_04010 [Chromatiaceae bacterium]